MMNRLDRLMHDLVLNIHADLSVGVPPGTYEGRWPSMNLDVLWLEVCSHSYLVRMRIRRWIWLALIENGSIDWPRPAAPWHASVGRLA